MNNIKDCENLSSKRVLLRLDLNVPLKNGDIVDETRMSLRRKLSFLKT